LSSIEALLNRPEFPRARRYDAEWMMDNHMGPNALWLVEWLSESLDLLPGQRVLDLGCGRAMTSVFLAREFGVQVFAADLWVSPGENWRRVANAGMADRVFPMKCEAHALPFAEGFFDAIVSVDAYHYFGTDELYASYLSRFLRPGGWMGVVVPGLTRELPDGGPAHLVAPQANGKVFWEDGCQAFKTPAFWAALWGRCLQLTGVRGELLADGWRHWRDWERALELAGKCIFPSDAEALDRDRGATLGLVRVLARRSEAGAQNFYDPALAVRVGPR
jgi:SAM-dependent methyltransferase